MLSAFKNRNPWIAALLALIGSPLIGFCYVNRGRYALIFLAAEFLVVVGLADISFSAVFSVFANIFGAIICFRIARKRDADEPIKLYARWQGLVGIFALILLLNTGAYLFRTYGYERFVISSASMSPNLNPGDKFWVDKSFYKHKSPERGDVIVFRTVKLPSITDYIKRVIGLPGDTVQISQGFLYVNSIKVPVESLGNIKLADSKGAINEVPEFIEKWPDGKFYKILIATNNGLLDNTPAYLVPKHQYFVLGDNRSNSMDSRMQDKIGFVDEKDIVAGMSLNNN